MKQNSFNFNFWQNQHSKKEKKKKNWTTQSLFTLCTILSRQEIGLIVQFLFDWESKKWS